LIYLPYLPQMCKQVLSLEAILETLDEQKKRQTLLVQSK